MLKGYWKLNVFWGFAGKMSEMKRKRSIFHDPVWINKIK